MARRGRSTKKRITNEIPGWLAEWAAGVPESQLPNLNRFSLLDIVADEEAFKTGLRKAIRSGRIPVGPDVALCSSELAALEAMLRQSNLPGVYVPAARLLS